MMPLSNSELLEEEGASPPAAGDAEPFDGGGGIPSVAIAIPGYTMLSPECDRGDLKLCLMLFASCWLI